MTIAVVIASAFVAFIAGWYLATVAWERAIARKGMDPDDFRRPLREVDVTPDPPPADKAF